jgi:hypothetical protein
MHNGRTSIERPRSELRSEWLAASRMQSGTVPIRNVSTLPPTGMPVNVHLRGSASVRVASWLRLRADGWSFAGCVRSFRSLEARWSPTTRTMFVAVLRCHANSNRVFVNLGAVSVTRCTTAALQVSDTLSNKILRSTPLRMKWIRSVDHRCTRSRVSVNGEAREASAVPFWAGEQEQQTHLEIKLARKLVRPIARFACLPGASNRNSMVSRENYCARNLLDCVNDEIGSFPSVTRSPGSKKLVFAARSMVWAGLDLR